MAGTLRAIRAAVAAAKSGRDYPSIEAPPRMEGPPDAIPPSGPRVSIQREHEQIARRFEIVVLDRVQVATATLHCDILLGTDRIGNGRALERRAEIEAPQLLELFVVIGDDPAVLERGEHEAAGRRGHARANLDIGHGLRHDLVADRVISADSAVVEIAGVGALLVPRPVEPAVRALESGGSAILAEAAFGAHAIRDVLHRIIGRRLIRNAAVPRGACAFHRIAAQRARLWHVALHIERGVIFERLAGLGVEALGPVQVVDVLAAAHEAAVVAVERIVEAVATEMAEHLAHLAVDVGVIQQVDADLVIVPRIVGQILVVPDQLAGIDIERDHGVGIEVVAGARLRIVLRHRVAGAPDGEPGGGIVGAGLPEAAAARLPGAGLVLPGLAARIAGLGDGVPSPQFVAGARIEPREPAAGRIAGAVGNEDLAVHRQRRGIELLTAAELVDRDDLLVPDDLAAVAVDGNDPSVGQV